MWFQVCFSKVSGKKKRDGFAGGNSNPAGEYCGNRSRASATSWRQWLLAAFGATYASKSGLWNAVAGKVASVSPKSNPMVLFFGVLRIVLFRDVLLHVVSLLLFGAYK